MYFLQIAHQVESWLDSINEIVEFSKQNLDVVCETIKMQEPGKKLLSEKNQKVYHEKIQDYFRGKMRNGKIYNRPEWNSKNLTPVETIIPLIAPQQEQISYHWVKGMGKLRTATSTGLER